MNNNDSYVLHIDFDLISKHLDRLKELNQEFAKEASSIVEVLREISLRLEPTLNKSMFEKDESVLWRHYQQLQREKLSILDVSHEWESVEETAKRLDSDLAIQIHDAVEELMEHVTVLGETHRAHIDVLEIQSTRSLSLTATVLSVIISYLAFWYVFARDLISGLVSTYDLSPDLEYVLLFLSILPIFIAISWGWRQRIKK
jgi:hypothetical protein